MPIEPDIARIAATIGDASRLRMLVLLMEGRALTAKELALGAGIEPGTATSHLRRLVDDGLLESTSQGRHKYFRFASEQVAQLVETLMRVAPKRKSLPKATQDDPIRRARFCYDHLAGSLGTGLLATLLRKKWLTPDSAGTGQLLVTPAGEKSLRAFNLDLEELRGRRRQFACTCLDWSERQDHLGGALGAALADHFTQQGWITRKKHSRLVLVSAEGAAHFKRLGIKLPV
ncbi:MAG TPA: winged helix-turn-helix domain-containing protein [Polaromonas sp.]|uniref:ArsR/SmtB family transcription factor n=1 Tax=Polaromonas sp. TaxID=1869339 RepID=UPI002D6FE348|nr:winged helix-turn-helix domain-containing protein [Polaromonas sp.]HYW55413.1 winged helix-turn-helix domain-containing protein [Polaromonas sp.]